MLYAIFLFIAISITYTLSTISPERKETLVDAYGNLWYLKASLLAPVVFGKAVLDTAQEYLAQRELDALNKDLDEQERFAESLKTQLDEEDLKK